MSPTKQTTPREKLRQLFIDHPSYLKNGSVSEVASKLGANVDDVIILRKEMRQSKYPVVGKMTYAKKIVPSDELTEKVKKVLVGRKKELSIEVISDLVDASPGKVREAIKSLGEIGLNVIETQEGHIVSPVIDKSEDFELVDIKKNSEGFYRFGAFGDQHYCSRYCREDVVNAMYDQYEREGIKIVFNTGNWIDGEARFNKTDLNVHGMDRQIEYFIKHFPKRKGVTTQFISGDDHEGWYVQQSGMNIGKYLELKAIEAGRTDLKFLGHMEADVIIPASEGETRIRVLHPGGGSAYAVSYTAQKIIESYTGGEKPNILLIGHYHKAEYLYNRGVHSLQTGTGEDQSPFMRKKRLSAHLGGWTFGFSTDKQGAVTRFSSEFFPFYDKKYYDKLWKYQF